MLMDAAIGLLSTTIVFGLVYTFHFLISSPRHLWLEAQESIKQNGILLAEWNELYQSKLIVACGSDVPGSKFISEDGCDFNKAFRVVIRSCGFNPIVHCQGRLISVTKNSEKIWENDIAILTFVKANSPESICKTIPKDAPQYLEILGVAEDNDGMGNITNRLLFGVNAHNRQFSSKLEKEFRDNRGEYIITIGITGHSTISVGATLRFIWTGDYEASTLTLIEQYSLSPTPFVNSPNSR